MQVRKLRHEAMKSIGKGHTAVKCGLREYADGQEGGNVDPLEEVSAAQPESGSSLAPLGRKEWCSGTGRSMKMSEAFFLVF